MEDIIKLALLSGVNNMVISLELHGYFLTIPNFTIIILVQPLNWADD